MWLIWCTAGFNLVLSSDGAFLGKNNLPSTIYWLALTSVKASYDDIHMSEVQCYQLIFEAIRKDTWWIWCSSEVVSATDYWSDGWWLNHAQCVIPENIQTPTTEGIGNSRGVGGVKSPGKSKGEGGWTDKSLSRGSTLIHSDVSCR